jgi:hypothetical protein
LENITFEINKDDRGVVSGFTLKGTGEYEAEAYCVSFPTAMMKAKAKIDFHDGKIVFAHEGVSEEDAEKTLDVFGISTGGTFSADIAPDDERALSALLEKRDEYANATLAVDYDFAWGKGFTLEARRN